jgi:hypothetical protein
MAFTDGGWQAKLAELLRNALLIILVLDNCHLNIVQHHANLNIRRKWCSKSPSLSPNPVKSKRITVMFFRLMSYNRAHCRQVFITGKQCANSANALGSPFQVVLIVAKSCPARS